MAIPVFGKEQYPLRKESGLSYTISDIYKHVPLHTHNHYELFIISEGTAYHLINDSVQTVKKGDLFFIRPNDMHSYSFFHSENFCVRNLGFSTQVLRNVSLFLEQEEKMDKLINSEMPSWLSELLLNMSKIFRKAMKECVSWRPVLRAISAG